MAARRVIKLGGSLLDWPEWPMRFGSWLAAQSPAANVLVVGGGPIVDGLRAIDGPCRLTAEHSHWLAIAGMELSARAAAAALTDARLIHSLDEADQLPVPALAILIVEPVLRQTRQTASALPETWQVTSDSIAANVATALGGCPLVLVKSASVPGGIGPVQWAAAGYVDAYFPHAAAGLSVEFVNLRSWQPCEQTQGRAR